MSMYDEYEQQEQDICDRINSGEITEAEYNQEMRELHQSWRQESEEAAQQAYDDEMERW